MRPDTLRDWLTVSCQCSAVLRTLCLEPHGESVVDDKLAQLSAVIDQCTEKMGR
jgi:hypothetical protein